MRLRLAALLMLGFAAPADAFDADTFDMESWLLEVYYSSATPAPIKQFYSALVYDIEVQRRRKAEWKAHARIARGEATYAAAAVREMQIPPEARTRIEAKQGGTVRRVDGTAAVIPSAALAQTLEVSVTHPPNDPTRESKAEQTKLSLASLPAAFGPEGTVFKTPVTLTLPYDARLVRTQGLRESNLALYYWNPGRQAWEALPSRVNAPDGTVSADVLHFSIYQVLGAGGINPLATDPELGFKALYAFPNPARGPGPVTFRVQPGQADSVELRVYDVSGRTVHESSAFVDRGAFDDGNGLGAQFTYDHTWDVSGIGSGVYTFAVTARRSGRADVRKTGRVAVIR